MRNKSVLYGNIDIQLKLHREDYHGQCTRITRNSSSVPYFSNSKRRWSNILHALKENKLQLKLIKQKKINFLSHWRNKTLP